jgi:hypothetical protein
LCRWTIGKDYGPLLASFEVPLPLERRSGFVDRVGAKDSASLGGTIGEIPTLLCGAELDAIERGIEHVMNATQSPSTSSSTTVS